MISSAPADRPGMTPPGYNASIWPYRDGGVMLKAYPVVVDVVVVWGSMDALGHVNNIVFLQYFETARIAYLERVGIGFADLGSSEHGVIVAANSCRYRVPVTFPDTLSVGVRVSALGNDRMIMEHAATTPQLRNLV